jgi:nicotinate-nucleotide adenylyltransferase
MSPPVEAPLHLLYGGTFDPLHRGHLAVARAALDVTRASRLEFLPAADPPHRAAPGAAFADRLDLIVAALASEPAPSSGAWGVDAREGARQGPSFTVDTLRDWRAGHGRHGALGFVLGADAFLGLPTWRDWSALFDLAHLVVALRPGSDLEAMPLPLGDAVAHRWTRDPADLHAAPAGRVYRLDLPLRQESATAVRRALHGGVGEGEGMAALAPEALPPAVAALVAARGLYGAAPRR